MDSKVTELREILRKAKRVLDQVPNTPENVEYVQDACREWFDLARANPPRPAATPQGPAETTAKISLLLRQHDSATRIAIIKAITSFFPEAQ